MQKKLIALAVAGLASTAAFAQTNVTIYGLVDYGYAYRFDGKAANAVNNGTPNSSSQLNGGQSLGNALPRTAVHAHVERGLGQAALGR